MLAQAMMKLNSNPSPTGATPGLVSRVTHTSWIFHLDTFIHIRFVALAQANQEITGKAQGDQNAQAPQPSLGKCPGLDPCNPKIHQKNEPG